MKTYQHTKTLPPGQYYFGDLCYVLSDDEWQGICELVSGTRETYFVTSEGRHAVVCSTIYGDGTYFDTSGRGYDVDSGTLGCVRVDGPIPIETTDEFQGGQVIDVTEPFEVSYADGWIFMGPVHINVNIPESD